MKHGVLAVILAAASVILCLSPTAIAVDHSPRWVGTALKYGPNGLPGEGSGNQYVDEIASGGYGYCRRALVLDHAEGSQYNSVAVDYNALSESPFSNSADTTINAGGLFLASTTKFGPRVTFSSVNANWSTPNRIWFAGQAFVQYYLQRYFSFGDAQLEPLFGSSAKKFIVLVHGWNPDSNSYAYNDQFADLKSSIETWLSANGLSSQWKVLLYRMEKDTDTGTANLSDMIAGTEAAEIARLHGYHMAELILGRHSSVERVHLIAHSAGSWAARSCMQYLVANASSSTFRCQVTLLDPYIPGAPDGPSLTSNLGIAEMNTLPSANRTRIYGLDNYYSDRHWGFVDVPGTGNSFAWGDKELLPDVCTDDVGNSDYYGHSGPIAYYADSVDWAGVGSFVGEGGWIKSMAYQEAFPPQKGPPTLGTVTDVGNGVASVTWQKPGVTPSYHVGCAWDIYTGQWIDGFSGSGMWYWFNGTAQSGNMNFGRSGAYHLWMCSDYSQSGGGFYACQNPWTGIIHSGKPHQPINVTATHLGNRQVKVQWKPDVYGTWIYWLIAYKDDEPNKGWIPVQGPLGNSYWHYTSYGAAQATLTMPYDGDYWVYLYAHGWDSQWSDPATVFASTWTGSQDEWRIVTSWAEDNDIDAHLQTPTTHVYYGNMGSLTSSPWAELDLDDTSGTGPETITISQLLSGTYKFYVCDFGASSTTTWFSNSSGCMVRLYRGPNYIGQWNIPTGQTGSYWHPFNIVNGSVQSVNQVRTSAP